MNWPSCTAEEAKRADAEYKIKLNNKENGGVYALRRHFGDIGQKELVKTAVAVEKSMVTAVQSFLQEV